MKKVIGLVPLYDDEKESYWMVPGYMKALEECGALPIMLPYTTDEEELLDAFSLCNGILMTGGHDVNPIMYAAERRPTCGTASNVRDVMESHLFEWSFKEDKPVLGICRGIQLINVLLGGTLYQDLPTEYDSDIEHHMSPPYDEVAHKVEILPDTPLASMYGKGEYGVNSYHHQAIKVLADEARPMAISEDGLVEAIYVPHKKYIWAVQWHPEFAYASDDKCLKLMQSFVDAC